VLSQGPIVCRQPRPPPPQTGARENLLLCTRSTPLQRTTPHGSHPTLLRGVFRGAP
jgi:hypothetical protein